MASGRGDRDRRPPLAPPAAPRRSRRWRPRRPRHLLRAIGAVILVLILIVAGVLFYYDSKLHRTDALAAYPGKPTDTPGTTWLIVGTDSRSDLSAQQRKALATGDADGARTDTIMLAYKPSGGGKPALVSIPRDLYVPIPGQGSHKINAAFNIGGPKLLVQTVEKLAGFRVDHFAEIGFGGFDRVVDGVGGVQMCIDHRLRDPKAGLNLRAGCQKLNGAQALGFVRTRAFPNADLERVVNQRKFLSALMSRATSASVLANPFRFFGFANGAVDTLTVDNGTHLWDLARLAMWLRGNPVTITTPDGGEESTGDGDSLSVGDNTEAFFGKIRAGAQLGKSDGDNSGVAP